VSVGLSDNLFFTRPFSLRVIPFQTFSGPLNMALDTWFAKHQNDREGVLRFYDWDPYCISIGCHQDISVIDLAKADREGIDVVRRPTGGRAIFHAEELTYSIVFPRAVIGHRDLYTWMHRMIASGLKDLGFMVDLSTGAHSLTRIRQTPSDFACFTRSARSEIQYRGKKVVGSAQKIYRGSTLQHGSILTGNIHMHLTDYLHADQAEKMLIEQEMKDRTITLSEIRDLKLTRKDIIETVLDQIRFTKNLTIAMRDLDPFELKQAQSCSEK
jgi:lipoate-protein ligase A